jgi:hypothetical protein
MTQRLHPSLIRDSDVGTAFKLLMRTLPYAMARFCVLLASATLCLVWLTVAFGGGWWIGSHGLCGRSSG